VSHSFNGKNSDQPDASSGAFYTSLTATLPIPLERKFLFQSKRFLEIGTGEMWFDASSVHRKIPYFWLLK